MNTLGRLSPDVLPIYYFEYGGKLITMNNRGLAALAEAGHKPTILHKVPLSKVPQKVINRLFETPIRRGLSVPGRSIPVTEDEAGRILYRIITLPQ